MPALTNRSRFFFLLFAIFSLAVFVRLLPGERIIDDAYITFRYARNLVNGAGFVYNPGERVLGTTTPLYTLLLAGLAVIVQTGNFPAIAVGVNALADGLTCCGLALLGHHMSGRWRVGVAAAILYAVAPFSVTFAIGGMETSVYVLLLTLTGILYLRQHTGWAASAALAVLTRPDALILIGPLALDYGLRALAQTQKPLSTRLMDIGKPALWFTLPLLPWVAFAAWYFGSPLPHSITAKSAAYRLAPTDALFRFLQHYSTPFFENLTIRFAPVLFGLMFAYFSLAVIGGLRAFRHHSCTLALSLYPPLYFLTFALANPLVFRWYLTPPLPLYFILLLTGLAHLIDSATRSARLSFEPQKANTVSRIAFLVPCLCFFVFSMRAWVWVPDHGPARPAPDMAWFKLEQLYTRIGQSLAPHIEADTTIAAGDIGALGYFSKAYILDTLGLVSPQSTPYYPLPPEQTVISYAIPAQLILDQRPDFVVFLEVYGRNTLLQSERFLQLYSLREKLPTDIYGSDGMLVYQRLGH